MRDYNVIKARKDKGRIVHLVANENGKTGTARWAAIRGGLSWPTGSSAAYSCILAEDLNYAPEIDQRGRIYMLSENLYEGVSLDMMFSKLTDEVTQFHCETIYTNTEESFVDFIEAYADFRSEKRVSLGSLDQAPFADNCMVGVSIIQDWIRTSRMEIPTGSLIYEELSMFSRQDIDDSPEVKYPAINGLRFALAAFCKSKPPRTSNRWRKGRRNAMTV